MSLENGNSTRRTTTIAMIERIRRVRSSIRCDRKDSCVSVVSLIVGGASIAPRSHPGWIPAAPRRVRRCQIFSKPGNAAWRGGSGGTAAAVGNVAGSAATGAIDAATGDAAGSGVAVATASAPAGRDVAGGVRNGLLEIARRTLHLALQLAQ